MDTNGIVHCITPILTTDRVCTTRTDAKCTHYTKFQMCSCLLNFTNKVKCNYSLINMWAVAMLRLCTLPVAMFSWYDVILRPATDINQRTYAEVMHRLCTLAISMFTVYYAIPLTDTDIHHVPVLRQCTDRYHTTNNRLCVT